MTTASGAQPPGTAAWTVRAATADVAAITTMNRRNGFPHAQGDPRRAEGWDLPNAAETGAWWVGERAVVLADPWFVHLFLPPDVAPDDEAAWPFWLAMLALRAGTPKAVRTAVPLDSAERWRFLERWPGRVVEDYTLLVQELDP